MRRTKVLEATTYHEAGHAVAAWRVGVRCKLLSTVADETSAGRHVHTPYFSGMNPEYDDSPRVQRRLENMALVCLAGPAAQRRFNPKGFRRAYARDDYHQAVDLLSYIAPDNEVLGAYVGLIEVLARKFVEAPRNWYCIESLADELLQRHEMSGREVRAAIRRALDQQLR